MSSVGPVKVSVCEFGGTSQGVTVSSVGPVKVPLCEFGGTSQGVIV